jgi:hypothetical protein
MSIRFGDAGFGDNLPKLFHRPIEIYKNQPVNGKAFPY